MKCEEELDEEDELDDEEEENPIELGEITQIADDLYILMEEDVVKKTGLYGARSIDFFEYLDLYRSFNHCTIEDELNYRARSNSYPSDDDSFIWCIRKHWKVCIYPRTNDEPYAPPSPGEAKQLREHNIRGIVLPYWILTAEEYAERDREEILGSCGQFWNDKPRPVYPSMGRSKLQSIGNYSLLLKIPSHVAKILMLKDGDVIGLQWDDCRRGNYVYFVTEDFARCSLKKKYRGGRVRVDAAPKNAIIDSNK